jgi:hypothetical protein
LYEISKGFESDCDYFSVVAEGFDLQLNNTNEKRRK